MVYSLNFLTFFLFMRMVFPNRIILVEPSRYKFKLKKSSRISARIRQRIMMCGFHAHLIEKLSSDNGQSLGVFQKELFVKFLMNLKKSIPIDLGIGF